MNASRVATADLESEQLSLIGAGTLMCSLPFAELWAEAGGLPVWWVVYHEDRIVGGLPGVEFGPKMLRRFQAMPDGCYTRFYLDPNAGLDRSAVGSAILKAIAEQGYAKAFIYDFFETIPVAESWEATDLATTLVDITTEWEPPDKKIRSEIRKAEREGVVVQTFDQSKHMPQFLALMEECERRHGRKPKYAPAFFELLSDLARQDNGVVWKWCEHEGESAASHILLIESDMALHWQVYFDKKFSFLKPNQLILQRTARELAANGVNRINLGASPPDAEGLHAYKAKWGRRSYTYRCYQLKRGIGKLL